jgi:hypothetical protein
MSRARPPENIEIASLKKKQQTVVNFMATGNGTPWEDRGSTSPVSAFFKTSGESLFSPGKLVAKIRRPETTNDARAFVIVCSGLWGLSAAIHTAIYLWRQTKDPLYMDTNTQMDVIWCLIAAAAGGFGCYLLFRIYNLIYAKLVTQEKDSGLIPDTLLYNINAYALGPSLFAPIPIAGPIIALLWIWIDAVVVGGSRIRLKPAAAIIDAVLGYISILAIAGVVMYGGKYLLSYTIGEPNEFRDKSVKLDPVTGKPVEVPGAPS